MKHRIRRRITVTGQVQGVGFRPFVYRLALEWGLGGVVRNTPEGVVIEIQGTDATVEGFSRDLTEKLPPLARILSLEASDMPPLPGDAAFVIGESAPGAGHNVLISPDVATCPNCLADMADPANRRHNYPFTNCTDCGPRYTITRSIPYDRATTSMACFPMCPDCAAEYADPLDRRFHAQPNACPVCGPKVWLTDAAGTTLAEHDPALAALARELAAGRIAAVKGLGGFHLACDAGSDAAVAELRQRKNRPAKPFAVMVPDMAAVERLAAPGALDAQAQALFSGSVRPIVLLATRPDGPLSALIGPDTRETGVMLPYTPLHHVLFSHLSRELGPERFPALVMTSGNAGGDPICLGNREALRRLSGIADIFLLHNRDILVRTDDSVVRPIPDAPPPAASPGRREDAEAAPGVQFLRRARGYVPSPVRLPVTGPCVLGTGPHLKCTLCLTKADQAFVSQHIGDMENLSTLAFYREMLAHFQDILQVAPARAVCDLHPDYLTTRLAEEELGLPVIRLQHHFAHIHAVLAECGHGPEAGPVIGLALDGTGYGGDGTLWGGECLYVDPAGPVHERLGHLSPMRLPGGEAAIRQPWRIAMGMLSDMGGEARAFTPPWLPAQDRAAALVVQMLEKNLNCPVSTSLGRLFDAVSALCGVGLQVDYEGQAAIRLETIQDMAETAAYACPLRRDSAPAVLDTLALVDQAARDLARGVPPGVVSRRFHLGLLDGLTELAATMADVRGTRRVALSGGCLLNRTLSRELPDRLRGRGLFPLSHRFLPPGDGCISLGQAAYGLLLRDGTSGTDNP
ncbi:carbamoyltransferase HypF [Desulfovibrio sulfodismutans]|uniref:Carbamoyltransferase n=1 Tax=Desulfolutivibrio sulfodismutans TaxID=63561 RepID=A0A7K3NM79_9BACT|nr:carbamoyltransferase HypF [Desulfolutivibrio sulfodismutans]NDY56885.1 carbamoyltransferase HypF [Desulfolutivibrio sulfodismutans]QLA10812.1 carbamoyltransferase HypF [Desulfolutivibrio sulfodismutans DSM 3696]